jgi:superfamily II DNA helicase RecQ
VQVIQFGVPSSLSVCIQRAGRAGRSPDINACAILLAEKSMFQWRKKKCRKNAADDLDSESDGSQSDRDDNGEEVGGDSDKMEWGKKVEPELRRWLETEDCRRDIADEYFNNPPPHKGQKLYVKTSY